MSNNPLTPFKRQSSVSQSSPVGATQPSHQQSQRQSVAELLSSPPPLEQLTPNLNANLNSYAPGNNDDITSINLSRNTSISSRNSSLLGIPNVGTNGNSIDWSEIQLSELIETNKLIFINDGMPIQKAFETLIVHDLTSIPVVKFDNDLNCLTFDYSDLNTYLLLVMNKVNLNELLTEGDTEVEKNETLNYINKAKRGEQVPVGEIIKLTPKNPFIKLYESDNLGSVVEILGNGVHRIAIINLQNKITGILSQRRLIKYLWENGRRFPSLESLFNQTLQELGIGSSKVITIQEDQLLIEALYKMFHEKISSVAVVDKNSNLIGNISIVDVKNVSSSKDSHLLFKSCLNFISYNLTLKGLEKGQDQFPIFHVSQQTSLGRTIAKLVATQSHRLWIVKPNSVSHSISSNSASSASSLIEDDGRPGKLVGVISLTDILGLFAFKAGKKIDPNYARKQRRRSSSSSANAEQFRRSFSGNSVLSNSDVSSSSSLKNISSSEKS